MRIHIGNRCPICCEKPDKCVGHRHGALTEEKLEKARWLIGENNRLLGKENDLLTNTERV